MVAAMFVGRLPNGMFSLGLVLLLHQLTGSYSASGTALAALMLGTTCSAPFRGRAVDRWGQLPVLIPLVVVQAAMMACFLLATLTRQSMLISIPLVAMVGATSSTLGGSMRRLWPVLVRSEDDLPTAYALQALLEDLISVTGPLAASALLVVASPLAILVAAEAFALVGTTVFVTARPARSVTVRAKQPTSVLGAVSTPGMRTLVMTLFAAGAVIGMLYIAVPALTQHPNGTSGAGPLLAVMAASSMISAVWYGGRVWRSEPGNRYVRLAAIFAAVTAPLFLARTAVQLGVMLTFVGLVYAPRMISAYLLLDDLAPKHSVAEAYTWLVSANAGGVALGSAIAGPVVQHLGARWALAAAATCAAVGYLTAHLRRRTLS
jgi:MFS family permease